MLGLGFFFVRGTCDSNTHLHDDRRTRNEFRFVRQHQKPHARVSQRFRCIRARYTKLVRSCTAVESWVTETEPSRLLG